MTVLRLILGDQLHENHSWFSTCDSNVIYLMAELDQEATYVTHHIQKLIGFFSAMRNFSDHLKDQGHRVHYVKISDRDNPHNLKDLINAALARFHAEKFEFQLPDEYRLDQQLREICADLHIPWEISDTEHFYTSRDTLSQFFKGRDQLLMEHFYRMMRRKHKILMDEKGDPEGGHWNYDRNNRNAWKGSPEIPNPPRYDHDIRKIADEIKDAGISSLGTADPDNFNWPLNRKESLALLDHFLEHLLPYFGTYQDAMHSEEPFLFHSRLSFALNTKMISPKEVIDAVSARYYSRPDKVGISQAEGFIRQILGWREYMRGIYWMQMPEYRLQNYFSNHNTLPGFYWTGKTRMNCLKRSILDSLKNAYAHHIQRLMVTGNFALLIQTHPDHTDQWYLGIYMDAIEWVEMTNTRGMSQYADGGLLATKPYISSANYINKMSNYCRDCVYDHRKRTGDHACPFNALYWNFLDDKKALLQANPRMGMMYRLLEKIPRKQLEEIRARSRKIMENPDLY